MARHRSKTPAAKVDIHAAVGAALDELQRRQAYKHLLHLEGRIAEFPPVPDAPPYVETFPDPPKS